MLALVMTIFTACGSSNDTETTEQSEPQVTEEEAETEAPQKAEGIGIHHVEIVVADYGTIKDRSARGLSGDAEIQIFKMAARYGALRV